MLSRISISAIGIGLLACVAIGAAGRPPASRPAAPPPAVTRPATPARPPAASQPAATSRPATWPDLSTPVTAARSYADAVLGAGDPSKTIVAVTVGDERAREQAEAAAVHAAGTYDLAAAVAEKFGEEGRKYLPGREVDRVRLLDLIAKATATIEGDRAVLLEAQSGWRLSLKRDRTANQWRVTLSPALPPDEHAKAVEYMRTQAKGLHELAAGVRAGKFKTTLEVENARQEMVRRLSPARAKLGLN